MQLFPPRSLAVALLFATLSPLLAQDSPEAPAPPVPAADPLPAPDPAPAPRPRSRDDAPIPQWRLDFDNLPKTAQNTYQKRLFEATRLFNQKRIFEALNETAEAEKIFDSGPAALNLKGACYVEFRDFERARTIFQEAYELQEAHLEGIEATVGEERRRRMRPVVNILFNIAEMDFVLGNWQECLDRIQFVLPHMDSRNVAMARLMEFKMMLCLIKLDRVEEARKLADKYDYLDDNPYYYYANSAMAYHDKDTEAAERWRASARKVFFRPELLAPWEDTMIEFGYVKSFYGGDLLEE